MVQEIEKSHVDQMGVENESLGYVEQKVVRSVVGVEYSIWPLMPSFKNSSCILK